jgi:hypothetical protein
MLISQAPDVKASCICMHPFAYKILLAGILQAFSGGIVQSPAANSFGMKV